MNQDLEYSRPIAAAAALGNDAEDRHRFIAKKVLLTGEVSVLETANGAKIARDALMLLVRICPNIAIAIPKDCGDVRANLEEISRRLAPHKALEFLDSEPSFSGYDAILSVGVSTRQALPWTVINSNGWLARISSGKKSLPSHCGQTNPVGALGAACLGVADVFKRLIGLRPGRGELLDGLSFSFWDYSTGSDSPGPELSVALDLDLLLVGAGAIGNGTVHLLSQLPVTGRALLVDRQDYGEENWGTCLCISNEDIGHPKAEVLAKLLRGRLTVEPHKMDIGQMHAKLGTAMHRPPVVLNGLDDIDPRHAVQMLWPDLAIDGAIGSDFSCQVSCHPWGKDTACLICLFRHARQTERAEAIQSRATGLPESAFEDQDAVVTEEHVRAAPEAKKAWLKAQVGKTVCSITPEAVAQMLSAETQRAGFSPSVPFVACFSSCMIVTELVRYIETGKTLPDPRYQLNLLWGPERGTDYPQARRRDCICVERAENIAKIRAQRS